MYTGPWLGQLWSCLCAGVRHESLPPPRSGRVDKANRNGGSRLWLPQHQWRNMSPTAPTTLSQQRTRAYAWGDTRCPEVTNDAVGNGISPPMTADSVRHLVEYIGSTGPYAPSPLLRSSKDGTSCGWYTRGATRWSPKSGTLWIRKKRNQGECWS